MVPMCTTCRLYVYATFIQQGFAGNHLSQTNLEIGH